jgi:hypothetical protein
MADFSTVRHAVSVARPASQAAVPDEVGIAAEPAMADTAQLRAERELLAMLAGMPELRGRARELLTLDLLSTPGHRRVAEVIAEVEEGTPASELFGMLEQRAPGAAKELSSAQLGESSADPVVLADGLERRLKEFELERRIAVGKGRLKVPGSFSSPAEYDEVFKEVSSLQRALDLLRRGQDAHNEDLEAQE